MAPAAGALAVVDVDDHVVIARGADAAGDVVEIQRVAQFPGDDVICHRAVARQAEAAEQDAIGAVQRQAAAKDIDAADALADQGILRGAEIGSFAGVGDLRVDGIAFLQANQAAAWLHGRVQLRGGNRQARQAEGICGVGFLRRDHAAARPLIATAGARHRHDHDFGVAVDDGGPHVETKAAVLFSDDRAQGFLNGVIARSLSPTVSS